MMIRDARDLQHYKGLPDSRALQTWVDSLLAFSLDASINQLARTPLLQERLEACEGFAADYLAKTKHVAARAFAGNDKAAKAEAHRALFGLYELQICRPDDPAVANQHDPLLYRVRTVLETAWLAAEQPAIHCPPEATVPTIQRLCEGHRAASHALFDFLANDADLVAMHRFFASDSALNIRFFDLLALSMVGSDEFARPELVQNLYDESGRGNAKEAHVRTFRDLLDDRGLAQARTDHIDALSWQGCAGHNLFMMTALSRAHYWKLLGVMAVTELIDPASYEKVVKGCRRLGLVQHAYRYYSEHVEIDVVHGRGWLDNVIVPLVAGTPAASAEIVLGAQLRLGSCEQYYDHLLSSLEQAQQAMV